jgi:glycerol-3-phosphate acyltransferase PlsY
MNAAAALLVVAAYLIGSLSFVLQYKLQCLFNIE